MNQMADAGKLDKNAMKKKYMDAANKKPGTASTVTSLDQLVTAGIIKSIPEPPAGQKYVLDVKTQKVRLENK